MKKIGVLGTGAVGRAIGSKLLSLGYEVMMGSRTSDNEKAVAWVAAGGQHAAQGTFADAAAFGELVFNCTKGMHTLEILDSAGAANLAGKVLIDTTNPLDFTHGFPPVLTVCNDDSMGEQIQQKFPETKVVKALNTLNCDIMVNPSLVNGGDHNLFICGNDIEAKATTVNLLAKFGWNPGNILDLGDITCCRGTEQILPLWVRLMGALGTPHFQFKIVK